MSAKKKPTPEVAEANLRSIGQQMSNAMFNLSQCEKRIPQESDRKLMRELWTAWDRAMDARPRPPPQKRSRTKKGAR